MIDQCPIAVNGGVAAAAACFCLAFKSKRVYCI